MGTSSGKRNTWKKAFGSGKWEHDSGESRVTSEITS